MKSIRALAKLSDALGAELDGEIDDEEIEDLLATLDRHRAALEGARERLVRRRDAVEG